MTQVLLLQSNKDESTNHTIEHMEFNIYISE